MKTIRPDETKPFDFYIDIKGDFIRNAYVTIYDRTDNSKTNLPAKIKSFGTTARYCRVVLTTCTAGTIYNVKVEYEIESGQTLEKNELIQCTSFSETLHPYMTENERREYTVKFDIPAGLLIDTDETTVTAYEYQTPAVNIGDTLLAATRVNGSTLYISFENVEKWKTYVVNVLAGTTPDSTTENTVYKIGKTLILQCKEI